MRIENRTKAWKTHYPLPNPLRGPGRTRRQGKIRLIGWWSGGAVYSLFSTWVQFSLCRMASTEYKLCKKMRKKCTICRYWMVQPLPESIIRRCRFMSYLYFYWKRWHSYVGTLLDFVVCTLMYRAESLPLLTNQQPRSGCFGNFLRRISLQRNNTENSKQIFLE